MKYKIIKEMCEAKKISLPELAEKIGMSKGGIYTAINNESLKIDALEKIAEILKVDISVFFETNSVDSNTNKYKKIIEFIRENNALNESSIYEHLLSKLIQFIYNDEFMNRFINSNLTKQNLTQMIEMSMFTDLINKSEFDFDKFYESAINNLKKEDFVKLFGGLRFVYFLNASIKNTNNEQTKIELNDRLKKIWDQYYDYIYAENSIFKIMKKESLIDDKTISEISSRVINLNFSLFE